MNLFAADDATLKLLLLPAAAGAAALPLSWPWLYIATTPADSFMKGAARVFRR